MGILKFFGLQRIKDVEKSIMPHPNTHIEDNNWYQHRYNSNLKQGIEALGGVGQVSIFDDGRGYELALDIKSKFILNYQRMLAERIKITSTNRDGNSTISVHMQNNDHG